MPTNSDNRIRALTGAPRLTAKRLSVGLTQEQLAQRAGISMRTVQRIEAGYPAYRGTLQLLANALGCDPDALTAEEVAA